MAREYRGSLGTVDWTDLEQVKKVAQSLGADIVRHPNNVGYCIPADTDKAVSEGATVVWRFGE